MPDRENDKRFLRRKEQRLLAELSRVRAKLEALEGGDEVVSQPEEPCKDCLDTEPTVEEEVTEPPKSEKKKPKKKIDKKDGE